MQWIAMLSMLVDHIGLVFYPDSPIWRIVGRLAFPLYCYGIVQGWQHTRDRQRYILRLSLIGAAAQLQYVLLFGFEQFNVIGTFIMVLAVFGILERCKPLYQAIVVIAACGVLEALPCEYGAYALLLALAYRHLQRWPLLAAHVALNLLAGVLLGWWLQIFSIASTILVMSWPRLQQESAPKVLWRSFYPAHLLVLLGIVNLFGGMGHE